MVAVVDLSDERAVFLLVDCDQDPVPMDQVSRLVQKSSGQAGEDVAGPHLTDPLVLGDRALPFPADGQPSDGDALTLPLPPGRYTRQSDWAEWLAVQTEHGRLNIDAEALPALLNMRAQARG